jgi:hypothetical protein
VASIIRHHFFVDLSINNQTRVNYQLVFVVLFNKQFDPCSLKSNQLIIRLNSTTEINEQIGINSTFLA